jgi:hypothetical protein
MRYADRSHAFLERDSPSKRLLDLLEEVLRKYVAHSPVFHEHLPNIHSLHSQSTSRVFPCENHPLLHACCSSSFLKQAKHRELNLQGLYGAQTQPALLTMAFLGHLLRASPGRWPLPHVQTRCCCRHRSACAPGPSRRLHRQENYLYSYFVFYMLTSFTILLLRILQSSLLCYILTLQTIVLLCKSLGSDQVSILLP